MTPAMHPKPAHPFADLIGMAMQRPEAGRSVATLTVRSDHLNPNGVLHGAITYAMADTGMGAALFSTLDAGDACATIDIHITYFRPVAEGSTVICSTELVNRGRSVAHLFSRITGDDGKLVAQASGNYAIFPRRPPA